MASRIAVPHNIFESRRGLIGADAHMWKHVDGKARLVLLLRPASVLSPGPAPSYEVLEAKVDAETQVSDLSSIPGPAMHARRHLFWKLARLVFPLPRPPDLFEYQLARRILSELGPLKPAGRIAWLNIEVRGENVYLQGGGEDPQYSWLLRNDRRLRLYLASRHIL